MAALCIYIKKKKKKAREIGKIKQVKQGKLNKSKVLLQSYDSFSRLFFFMLITKFD